MKKIVAKILSYNNAEKRNPEENILQYFWYRFTVLNTPTKVVIVSLALLLLAVPFFTSRTRHDIRQRAAAPYLFGTLMTDPDKATQEAATGIKMAMLEFEWRRYEPTEGNFDLTYINALKQAVAKYKAAGMSITLAFGMHYTPSWIFTYADSKYINQSGAAATQANFVFNQVLRQKAENYMRRLSTDLEIQNFTAIRIHSGGDPELLYPSGTNAYWAYDRNAQNGVNMPPSMPRNPFPGWRPGDRSIGTAQVAQWYDWYVKALDDSAIWQMNFFKSIGYTGQFQILTPGSGVRPDRLSFLINNYLNDSSEVVTGRGAAWSKVYEFLPRDPKIVVYVSSMADGSGNNDSCQPTDSTMVLTDTLMNSWSAVRWQSAIANKYGYLKNGENAGYGDAPGYGPGVTDATPIMRLAMQQMSACNFQGMYWAHDHNLYDGTSGITLQDYNNLISQYNPIILSPTPTTTPPPTATPTPSSGTISIDDAVQGTGLNQFAYVGGNWGHCSACTGGYKQTTSWDNIANQYVTLQFSGTQLQYYGEKASHHGIVAASIDGGPETMLDLFSTTRLENQLLWTSPVLSNTTHTFKLRVTGTKNSLATDTVVSLDQVVVSSGGGVLPTMPPTVPPALPTNTPTPGISDGAPPSVEITDPLNGGSILRNSTLTITANAADNVGIAKVVFSVDGKTFIDTTSPYRMQWQVPGKPRVTYTITATAYDTANNSAMSTVRVLSQ